MYALGRLPGINGDEARYGVQVLRFLAGDAVDWRTPTGNLMAPLHFGMLLGIQCFLDPSLVILRLPSLLSSLLQLGLTYVVVRRHFDATTGALALVLTAVLPVNIAYARFGAETSHSGLVAIIAADFALAGNLWGSALAFALALVVHPTNVFFAPFLVLAFLSADWPRRGKLQALMRSALHVGLLMAALEVISLTWLGGRAAVAWHEAINRLTTPAEWEGWKSFARLFSHLLTGDTVGWHEAINRLTTPAEWGGFAQLFSRLLTGDTVYKYIAGSGLGDARDPADVAVAVVLLGMLGLAAWRLRKQAWGPAQGVVLGWLASLVAFFFIAGNSAIQPSVERFAVCLLVPTVLAVSVLLQELGERGACLWRPYVLTGAVAALLLLGFHLRYFRYMESTGGTSEKTFWTGEVEPKEAAFKRIFAEAQGRGGARIVAENWWVYWPLAYLAWGKPLDVVLLSKGDHPSTLSGRPGVALLEGDHPSTVSGRPGGTYWVDFPGGSIEQDFRAQGIGASRWDIPGFGRPVALRVWWTPEPIF
jgi:hypothetical protein